MPALKIKKNTFSERKKQEFYERYGKAKRVHLPSLIEDRYGIQFSFAGSVKNGDAEGHGLRVGLTQDKHSGEPVWLAAGSAQGDAVQSVTQLDKQYLNKDTSITEAIKIIEGYQQKNNVTSSHSSSDTKQHSNSVAKLHGNTGSQNLRLPKIADREAEDHLLEYARGRGIAWSTINMAEADGFLQKSATGFTFLGRSATGQVKNAETRLMKPIVTDSGKELRFLCAEGSDRSFPPILHGSESATSVHLVEGGFDALGLRERLNRTGEDAHIIVSGGKDNSKWLDQPHIQNLLHGREVVVWRDNEKTQDVQEQADMAFQNTLLALKKAGVEEVEVMMPPMGIKDSAELNRIEKEQLRLESQRQYEQHEELNSSRSH